MKKHLILSLFILIFLGSCNKDNKTKKEEYPVITSVFEAYYQDNLKLNPLNATRAGDNRYNDILPNNLSDEFVKKEKEFYTNYKEKLSHYNDADLNESEKTTKAILNWDCEVNLERLTFKNYRPIDQMWSLNLQMGQFAGGTSAQPFNTIKDYNDWLSRLDDYTKWLISAEEMMREGIKVGNVLPKSLIKKVIPQLASMANTDIEDHLFFSPVKNFPEAFADDEKEKLKMAFEKKIKENIIPTYQKLHNFMNTEYMDAGRTSSGINDIPNGETYYKHQIKKYTTTTMTADEIHTLGLSEVKRILSEMEKVKTQVAFKGTIKEFFNHVRENKQLMPFTEPQQVIDNFNAIHERMKPQVEKLFDLKPKTKFKVRRTEAFREASASAEYNQGSLDGTRPGIFYTPIPDVTKYNMFSDESLFLHEAIPGHHYQISLQQENTKLPNFRKTLWYSAYGEGWALYSESLGKELGLLTDPYQYFGMLSAEMHRAIRLVVDTGLHSKGWTREQAIQYSLDNEAESEASITSEIERYMANPGQALSYKIGQLKIRELRSKAEHELGDKFDIRQFHNQVLETGCIPLKLLEDKINSWISAKK